MLASHRSKRPLNAPLHFCQIAPFLTFPSPIHFAVGVGDLDRPKEEEPIYTWEFGPRVSAVTQLGLAHMKFDRVKYDEFFSGIKALRPFKLFA
jgi:hypothetical protein